MQMRGKRVGVEKPGRASKASADALFSMPDDTTAIGIIRYIGTDLQNSDLKVGMKVCFGDKREQLKLNGSDIMVMDESNIYAIVEDSSVEEKKASA